MSRNSLLWVGICVCLLIFAIFIRTVNLQTNPTGIFVDEASHGLEATSILKTGKDTHDVLFPVFFQAIQDYKDPVFIYSLVPVVALLGSTIFAVRILSAIYGIASVVMMYLFLKEASNKKVALFGAIMLAILPWHVHFSRIGFQLIASIFWFLFSFYVYEKSLKNLKWIPVFFGGLVVTFFTYSVAKMYVLPIFVVLLLFHWRTTKQWLSKKTFWFSSSIALMVTLGLIFPYLKDGSFFQRWTQVQPTAPHGVTIFWTYIAHFSPMYLFIGGDAGFPGQYLTRHSLSGLGELYLFQLPFIIVGCIVPYFLKSFKSLRFMIPLMFLFPVGSMFSHELPQATRSSFGIIPFTVLTAVGIVYLYELCHSLKARFLYLYVLSGIILISCIELVVALNRYPLKSSGYWGFQMGMKECLELYKRWEYEYDHLYVTHRFNRTQELMDFNNMTIGCHKCLIISNPIEIQKGNNIYALRMEDILEAYDRYKGVHFQLKETIRQPNGIDELYVGTFAHVSGK